MQTHHSKLHAARRGFTLLEMMLVLVIIGLLSTVAIYSLGGIGNRAKVQTTKLRMRQLKSSLSAYNLDKSGYPPTLTVLTQGTTAYIEQLPTDSWQRPFVYAVPGTNGKPYTLYSLGNDGEGGSADDVDVWTMDEEPAQTN